MDSNKGLTLHRFWAAGSTCPVPHSCDTTYNTVVTGHKSSHRWAVSGRHPACGLTLNTVKPVFFASPLFRDPDEFAKITGREYIF